MNVRITSTEFAVEKIFTGFRIATMARPGTVLDPDSGNDGPVVSDQPYGALTDFAIGVTDGKIEWVLPTDSVPEFSTSEVIQGNGHWLTPGLIDCHTHLVYGGNRSEEWEARLKGASYEEIAKAGGGILSSVNSTRAASEEELVRAASSRLGRLIEEGVTTVEIKSGYGLDLPTELKMLKAARQLESIHPVDIQTTLLAAHAVPPEYKGRDDEYVDLICNEIIPAAKPYCQAVDAFCESIAFSVEQTRRVLQAALDAGLLIKVHAEQLTHTGMAAEAARMGALSCDHLEFLTESDCQVMAQRRTVATLLPGAFFCLKETQKPPIDALLATGVPIAIASDSNPGSSPVLSLLTIGNFACNLFGLTPEQVLLGMTRNAASALGMSDRGEIKPGAIADFAIWDVKSPGELYYQIGANPCVNVYKNGSPRNRLGMPPVS